MKYCKKCDDKLIVMDVGSSKSSLCELIADEKNRGRFVPSHPIAGTAYSGPESLATSSKRN